MSKRNLWIIIIILSVLLLRSWLSDDAPGTPETTSEVAVQPAKPTSARAPDLAPAVRPAPAPWQPPGPAQPAYLQRDYYSRPPAPAQTSPYAFPPAPARNPRPQPSYQPPAAPSYETVQTDRYSTAPSQPLQQPWDSYYSPPSQQPPAPPEYSQPRGRWTGNYSQQAPQWQFRK